MVNVPKIYFLTGSSGAGKTSLLQLLSKEYNDDSVFLYFDDIGIPNEEYMIKEYGSGSNWQKATTLIWVEKILNQYANKKLIFFEGSVNINFIKEAFANFNFTNYHIILIHCNDIVRNKRLCDMRNQPELARDEMDNWSKLLYDQAMKENLVIINTSDGITEELIKWCKDNFK